MSLESINIKIRRLNSLILGQQMPICKNKLLPVVLSREYLLDAFFLLYNECSKDNMKKRDKSITDFITEYRSVVAEAKLLRINSNDFIEKETIGKGFFGTVHLVTEKVTGDIYAMKKIRKSLETASQVKEERDIMSRRCSKWITNLQYSFQDSDYLYLVMEYLPGGDLLSLMIRNGPFEEEIVKFYLSEIVLALNDLHLMGYVHRDVKPENILIDRFGHIKLADFGNAAVLNKDGYVISLSPVGTPYYIAPELLQTISLTEKASHDVTCDFWSMGIIAYEMVFESTPFYSENIHDTYSKILTFCEDSNKIETLMFPRDVKVTDNFRNLIENLVNKSSKRLSFSKIQKHKFFEKTKWDSLYEQMPPFIPSLKSEDDISNFEDIEKIRGMRSTYITKSVSSNLDSSDFSGKDLPFLGYGFIYQEKLLSDHLNQANNEEKVYKLNNKIKEMEIIKTNQSEEIKCLQESLFKAEKKVKQSDSTSKILSEVKDEIIRMKERLKQKTIELAHCKTEIKTLQNSLKIEEEQRSKNDATISEILSSTYKKWEKAKAASDQNYEKQIAEKITEIINLSQKLSCCESELATKYEEVEQFNSQILNYKERLQNVRDHTSADKKEFEKIKLSMQESYEANLIDLKTKLKMEKDLKNRLAYELRDVRSELDESIQSTNNNLQAKIKTEKNMDETRQRLNREIEINNTLRSENAKIEKLRNDLQKAYDCLLYENEKLKQENQIRESAKNLNLESGLCSQYQSARGSLTELHKIEEQLRNDLVIAKEEEDRQRNRADQLEKIVAKLEDMVDKMEKQPKSLENVLEKQNEKLEDKLSTVKEQMIIERQSARAANLSLWKIEKQVEELQNEKKIIQRRLDLNEDKLQRFKNQKLDIELRVKELESNIKQKNNIIEELRDEIKNSKIEVQKEHLAYEKTEKECVEFKSEILEHVNNIHRLNEKTEDLNQKLLQTRLKQDTFNLENKRLLKELNNERDNFSSFLEQLNELKIKLKSSQENYEVLKIACTITDQQLTEVETLLDAELKRNKSNQEKIDNLYKSVRQKEDMISQLKKDLNVETSKKLDAENKIKDLQIVHDEFKDNMEHIHKQLISQQNQLINSTNNLFITQEKLELITAESNNLQIMCENFEKEVGILKEESARILTELFLTKEEKNKLNQELNISVKNVRRLQEENEELKSSVEEQKNFYIQRDIKSEATLMQHKKLIDYLQLKVEDLSQKKKKTFADKLFGTATLNDKKENIDPNGVESSILYRTLQEELNREKQKSRILQERMEKLKITRQICSLECSSNKKLDVSSIRKSGSQNIAIESQQSCNMEAIKDAETTQNGILGSCPSNLKTNHRFELNLDTGNTNLHCMICSLPILSGSPYWLCKECKSTVHRKCRNEVNISCHFLQNVIIEKEISDVKNLQEVDNTSGNSMHTSLCETHYCGEFVISAEIVNPPLQINCAYHLLPDIILLGTTTGLFAYDWSSNSLSKIAEVENVQFITLSIVVFKVLIVANDGHDLLQCDLRQLQNRSKSKICIRPSLEMRKIYLSQLSEYRNKIYLVKISNEPQDVFALVAGSYQITIMKYEISSQNFIPIRSLKTPAVVMSILFTRHTVIISADKFLEIDLDTYTAEEFIDLSDPTLDHLQNYQPMNIFNISAQEYFVCFAECGIFVDEYGCRSRPYEVTWEYTPTGFLYQEPYLYVSHFQLIQVIRLHRSCQNEVLSNKTGNEDLCLKRAYLNLYMPTLLGLCGNYSCLSSTINRNSGIQELYLLDGHKALKIKSRISDETLSSQPTCLTIESESSSTS